MAKKAITKKSTKTGTTDAGKKRSLARRFNDSLTNKVTTAGATSLDQRTAKRLERYKVELKNGKTGRGKRLTPLDVAMRIDELLAHGEKLTDLRKLTKPRSVDLDIDQLTGILREMHPIYGYRPDAYRFAGVSNDALLAASIIDRLPARRGPKPSGKKTSTRKPSAKKKSKKA